jgi:hypothetical protein
MKIPNKVFSFEESVVSKFTPILNLLKSGSFKVNDLFHKSGITDVIDFVDTLDCLFAMNKIYFDEDKKVVLLCS